MHCPLLHALLLVILGAYGLSTQATGQEQPESEQMAKLSAHTQAARQDQARILASMITGRVNYPEKNKQLENQASEIKRRKKECQLTSSALKSAISRHQELKNFLTYLADRIGFPYGVQAITQFLDDQAREVTREMRSIQREIRRDEKTVKKYEKEKAQLITELNKPELNNPENINKSGTHQNRKSSTAATAQATDPSLASRTWTWIFGTKTTAPQVAPAAHNAESELQPTHGRLQLKVHKATDSLNACKQEIVRLQNTRIELLHDIEKVSQEIINKLSRSDMFATQRELARAQLSMQSLRNSYINLDAISIRLHEVKAHKYELLFEIDGMGKTSY